MPLPILIVPIFTTFILGIIYIYVISIPIGACMDWLVKFLSGMQGGNAVLLGAIIGAMTAVDMGGPINKTATAFTLALMAEAEYKRIKLIPKIITAVKDVIEGSLSVVLMTKANNPTNAKIAPIK